MELPQRRSEITSVKRWEMSRRKTPDRAEHPCSESPEMSDDMPVLIYVNYVIV